MTLAYRIVLAPEVSAQLRSLTARQVAIVMDAIQKQLLHQPTIETRNRKPMRPNNIAAWELRVQQLARFLQRGRGTGADGIDLCSRDQKRQPRIHRRRGGRRMKTLEITQVDAAFVAQLRELSKERLILLDGGRPIAVLLPSEGADVETISLSFSAKFLAIMERSKKSLHEGKGLSLEEVRRQFGLPPFAGKKKVKANGRKPRPERRKNSGEKNGGQV